jgi:uncharacterized membrane protein YqjE
MDHQTRKGEQNSSPQSAPRGLAGEVGEFAHDVFTLAELQAQLLAADVKQCSRRVLAPGLALLCGVALGLACVPVALAGLALLVTQVFGTSYAAGFLIAALVGAVLSALLCIIGWFQVRERVTVLGRSQQELFRNLRWIKKVLERSRITRRNGNDNSWRTMT